MHPVDLLRRLPAHVINGTTVSMGIGLVYLLFRTCADPHAAQLAICGAIYASLADVPDTPSRSWRQVLAAGVLGCTAALVVLLLKPFALALGAGIMLVVFVAMLTLAWGPRAGPISFAPVLSIVFSIGFPPGQDPLATVGWHLLGLATYLPWSLAAATLLQPRYRSLALAAALAATARLLRSRARMLGGAAGEAQAGALQDWVREEAALAERLQTARDLLFAAPETPRAECETAVLLRIVDVRDILLASSLDLELMGNDAIAQRIRAGLGAQLCEMADVVEASRVLLRGASAASPSACGEYTTGRVFGDMQLPVDDARARLLPAIVNRLRHLGAHVDRMHALLRGEQETLPLSRSELQRFVAPEGWPLGVLRNHASIDSPVFRHAVRATLALGCAYYFALLLPWTRHPQWLVLGVAVVLRGNLQQTLARRNARIGGTVLGCLLVLLLSHVSSPDLLMLTFVVAAGVAHGFVVERYLITAVAATVMALLQAHLVAPAIGFPIGERLADTMLGALLAWAFSYVLPFWERRGLPQAIARALHALQ
ncbi:MAG: FUSC family protein, partial [Betaproteobacteria bacterium]|nr:FUSC family protein [Betaproteobacteria bacterium]